MKFAIVNNQRKEATPKTKGICPVCHTPVISKCGTIKSHHWAHETKQNCKNDRWEIEGQWHRNWKNLFPEEWQEQIVIYNNEKNVADIRTSQGLVIEFQHSHITPEEQKSRENAYGNMIWVVDGTRLSGDLYRFSEGLSKNKDDIETFFELQQEFKVALVDFYKDLFNKNWLNSKVPVIFDFLELGKKNMNDMFNKYLFCLLPIRCGYKTTYQHTQASFLFYIKRNDFIFIIKNNTWNYFYDKLYCSIYSIIYLSKICYADQISKYKKELSIILEKVYNKSISETMI